MKKLLLLQVIAAVLGSAFSQAAIIPLGDNGQLDIDIPASWKSDVTNQSTEYGAGYTIKLTPVNDTNLELWITLTASARLTNMAKDTLFTTMQEGGDEVAKSGKSVEKKVTLIPLEIENGFGAYYLLTDASLAGNAPAPDDYKVVALSQIYYNQNILATATIYTDDVGSGDFKDILEIISRMKPVLSTPAKAEGSAAPAGYEIELTKNDQGTLIGNPYISRVSLLLPSKDYNTAPEAKGAGRGNPGYFIGRDMNAGITMSGWFEPQYKFRYKNAKELWKSDKPNKAKNIEYLKINDWDVMLYEMELPIGGTNSRIVTLRASLVLAGSWIDLHLSIAGIDDRAGMRKKLTDYLGAIQVIVGKALGFQLERSKDGISIFAPEETTKPLFIKSKNISVLKSGSQTKPGFFMFQDVEENIKIIVWLRPSTDYQYGKIEQLWEETKASLLNAGIEVTNDLEYRKAQDWEVMYYDLKTSDQRKHNVNMRASCINDGIWFDAHLSIVDQRTSSFLRDKLLGYLKNLSVAGRQIE